ncbi:hypothetical protein ANN_14760 [Periplaneta americana]|uniref:MADF domain-containing protein n=1 Tax=Periplaneta americana TaxID=6978 RepID=A0ABQ8SX57_PERAM|nr:hypothetical protein ANN_14760 [Periplaneta americana]
MAGLCESDNEPPGSLKAIAVGIDFAHVVVITEDVQNVHLLLEYRPHIDVSLTCEHDPKLQEYCQEDRDITYALFCSVLCIMEHDEILILSVEENPHVYDKQRASYKDEKMKENTWLSIAASLNTDHVKLRLKRSIQLFLKTFNSRVPVDGTYVVVTAQALLFSHTFGVVLWGISYSDLEFYRKNLSRILGTRIECAT